jgi:sugar phosphate isomerase/epimerase
MDKPKISRRKALSALSLGTAAATIPLGGCVAGAVKTVVSDKTKFRFCLNTSTISGQKPGLEKYIDIASEAGYDGIEVWVRDVKAYLEGGNSLADLRTRIEDSGIIVESAIGFAPWMTGSEEGFRQMEEEMNMLASIGCLRIAAPPAGVPADEPLDLLRAGEHYRKILELGRKTGVMPQLEFWGASPVLWHLGQVLMVAAAADDPDTRILPDIYHLFRGGSGFHGLKMLSGSLIELFHMNDYPAGKPRLEQNDADRIYPGDGTAPLEKIIKDLSEMGGEMALSLELFNRDYWQQDPLEVAKIGLQKMKSLV